MATQIVMDHKGDTQYNFDPKDADALLRAEERFKELTRAGFTETMIGSASSATGTQMYMAPELFAGRPASIRSDIYSLGVVLYQLLVADFSHPLTMAKLASRRFSALKISRRVSQ